MNGGGVVNGQGGIQVDPSAVDRIKQALDVIYAPNSSNDTRNQAQIFLDQLKTSNEAPHYGFSLASDNSQSPIVRYYALQLLEYGIRFNWPDYSDQQKEMIRNWELVLAGNVTDSDPPYLRNKVGQLWADIAKRSWGADWQNMDELLVDLWSRGNRGQRDLCLHILETLVGDVFAREDAIAGLRNAVLSKACITVFTPVAAIPENSDTADTVARHGTEGWLGRLVVFLQECLAAGPQDAGAADCASRVLAALKACVTWISPRSIAVAKVVESVGQALTFDNVSVRLIATECLQLIFSRQFREDQDFVQVFSPVLHPSTVQLLLQIFQFTQVDPDGIDDEAYTFLQKFSEMISSLQSSIENRLSLLSSSEIDILSFLKLLFFVARHDSLIVSAPAITAWTRIFRSPYMNLPEVTTSMPELLALATERLIKYEVLKDDDNAALKYLDADFDTLPEKHAFLGNYRRFCGGLIESVVRRKPYEAFPFILNAVDIFLNELVRNQVPLDVNTYDKNQTPFLKVDAHFLAVESAIKGFMKASVAEGPIDANRRAEFESLLEGWLVSVLNMQFEDPLIRRRVIQLAVSISTTILEHKPEMMLKTLEHILFTRPKDGPPNSAYSEAVKDLQTVCYPEMQRLAVLMPDSLMNVYDQLKLKIDEIMQKEVVDDRQTIAFHTFLFTINHRTTNIDPDMQLTRLQTYIQPIRAQWQQPQLTEALSSFNGFCHLLGLDKAQQYLISRRVHEIKDFSSCPLDAEGLALQADLQEKLKLLPIRPTKAFLGVSTDKLTNPSRAYTVACDLWRETFMQILPNLLNFLQHAHGFHNPENWGGLPQEFQPVIRKVLTDRFWQSGISGGSRDQFYENVNKTKTTLEGLASTIRGTIRMVRESCYSILWCMSRLDNLFYGIEALPGPLSHALFADAHCLSSHQMSILLNMTRYIIEDCPPHLRSHFLTPFLTTLFAQVDRKITNEWALLSQKSQSSSLENEDQLAEEMKEESILRQLTYIAVLMVTSILEATPRITDPSLSPAQVNLEDESMRRFVLSRDAILERLVLFCIHALRMHDSRCCGMIIRVFRSLIPEFVKDREEIREFICREVLTASIDSLHDDYFVDVQRDLAQLIATVFVLYSPVSDTPRKILLSLPGMTEERVDSCAKRLMTANSSRVQRAYILNLLENIRGVPLSEKGKLQIPKKQTSSGAQAAQRQAEMEKRNVKQESPDLGGIADMFA